MKKLLLSVALLSLAAPALAGEWFHATAPMGQYEGQIRMDDDAYGMSYGCAGFYSTLTLFAEGSHVGSGKSTIEVDGAKVGSLDTEYNSESDNTVAMLHVKSPDNKDQFEGYALILNALASGNEAVWATPTGKTFTFPLKDSARIKACILS